MDSLLADGHHLVNGSRCIVQAFSRYRHFCAEVLAVLVTTESAKGKGVLVRNLDDTEDTQAPENHAMHG
jgi:hypothetical protein